jgi:hypothetical protein
MRAQALQYSLPALDPASKQVLSDTFELEIKIDTNSGEEFNNPSKVQSNSISSKTETIRDVQFLTNPANTIAIKYSRVRITTSDSGTPLINPAEGKSYLVERSGDVLTVKNSDGSTTSADESKFVLADVSSIAVLGTATSPLAIQIGDPLNLGTNDRVRLFGPQSAMLSDNLRLVLVRVDSKNGVGEGVFSATLRISDTQFGTSDFSGELLLIGTGLGAKLDVTAIKTESRPLSVTNAKVTSQTTQHVKFERKIDLGS